MEKTPIALGIDIGGSAIKAALVNTLNGEIISERYKVATPEVPSIDNVFSEVETIINHFNWHDPIGCTFPGVIINGTIKTAANMHPSCIDQNLSQFITQKTQAHAYSINDADAAGLAEMHFGAGKSFMGSCLLVTIGTGLGSALFINGRLFPNTEFGHIKMNNVSVETTTSAAVKKRENLSWEAWTIRLNTYLNYLHSLLWPELIILGGGISKDFDLFAHLLKVPTKIIPAKLKNNAGIIGAAFLTNKDL